MSIVSILNNVSSQFEGLTEKVKVSTGRNAENYIELKTPSGHDFWIGNIPFEKAEKVFETMILFVPQLNESIWNLVTVVADQNIKKTANSALEHCLYDGNPIKNINMLAKMIYFTQDLLFMRLAICLHCFTYFQELGEILKMFNMAMDSNKQQNSETELEKKNKGYDS